MSKFCVTSCAFDEKRGTKPKFVAQSWPALYFSLRSTFSSTCNKCFCSVRYELITQGDKRETSTQNLQRNNFARQVKSFLISYFAAFEQSTTTTTAAVATRTSCIINLCTSLCRPPRNSNLKSSTRIWTFFNPDTATTRIRRIR